MRVLDCAVCVCAFCRFGLFVYIILISETWRNFAVISIISLANAHSSLCTYLRGFYIYYCYLAEHFTCVSGLAVLPNNADDDNNNDSDEEEEDQRDAVFGLAQDSGTLGDGEQIRRTITMVRRVLCVVIVFMHTFLADCCVRIGTSMSSEQRILSLFLSPKKSSTAMDSP
jgi:hypothetical protein